jgi:hypothetical protein
LFGISDFSHCDCRKIRVIDCFFNEPIFNQKHQENILIILLNQLLTSKSVRNHFKTQNQPESQFFLGLIFFFFCTCKVEKHLIQTSFVIWNYLEQKYNILMVRIVEITYFSLLVRIRWSPLYPLLSPNKNWKMMKINFNIEINFSRIKRIDHLIDKKDGNLNVLFK